MLRQVCFSFGLLILLTSFANAQDGKYRFVFSSREYKAVGRSDPQLWMMTLPGKQKVKYAPATCSPQPVQSATLPAGISLPERGAHWNYLTGVSASPDGKLLLIGSEAGSSDSHFEDYWLFDRASNSLKYVGGGNGAQWSPDSSKIMWSTPRSLGPIGKIHVWVSHLVVVDVGTLEQQAVTSGISYEDKFFWCSSGKTPMATLRDRFENAAAVKPADLAGDWVLIRNINTEKFITGGEGPDHVEFNAGGVQSQMLRQDVPRPTQDNPLEWVATFKMLPAGGVEITSHTSWSGDDKSAVTITPTGEAVFTKSYGGDSPYIYRCRLATPRNLICLFRNHEDGHGVEFLKTMQVGGLEENSTAGGQVARLSSGPFIKRTVTGIEDGSRDEFIQGQEIR
jgi:hypothetical protein